MEVDNAVGVIPLPFRDPVCVQCAGTSPDLCQCIGPGLANQRPPGLEMSVTTDTAIPLAPAAREAHYREAKSFAALRRQTLRGFGRLGWALAGVSTLYGAAVTAGWLWYPVTVYTPPLYMRVNSITGWVGEATAAYDAPKLFDDKVAKATLVEYLWARLRYTPEIDQTNWQRVRSMTAAQAWPQYEAELAAKDSPKRVLGREGHADVFGITFGSALKSPDGTLTYPVRFFRRFVRNGDSGEIAPHPCNTEISFQWHPELVQTSQQAQLNPTGMQVISFRPLECS